jgi:Mce-associated membrane protein
MSNLLRGRAARIGALVAGLVAVALAVLLWVQISSYHDGRDQVRLRTQVLAAADREVLKLTSLTAAGAQADIKALLADATAGYKDQLAQIATDLQKAITQAKVRTSAVIAASGISRFDAQRHTAVVLVAAQQTIHNSSVPAGEQRNYRLQVTMKKLGAKWFVSDMRFVA